MGKNKYIETPERLLEMFNEYKQFTKDNPRYKHQLCQRTAEMVKEPLEVPLTIEGFRVYCYNIFKFIYIAQVPLQSVPADAAKSKSIV